MNGLIYLAGYGTTVGSTANDERSSYSRRQQRFTLRSWHFWQRCGQCPYLTRHLNRFGRYDLDMEKLPPELVYDLWK